MNFDGNEELFLPNGNSLYVQRIVQGLDCFCDFWNRVNFRACIDSFIIPEIKYVKDSCIEYSVIESSKMAYGVVRTNGADFFIISNVTLKDEEVYQ